VIDCRAEIAAIAGVAPERLHVVKESLVDALLRKGVVVRVHIGRWRARRKLRADDLGLDPEAARPLLEQVDLGARLLLPRATLEKLDRLESQGRSNLRRYSLDTRLGSFVPADGLPRFLEAHQALRAQYLAMRDEIVARLPSLQDEVKQACACAAETLYDALRTAAGVTRAAFVAQYVERALAAWPTAGQVHASFAFDYDLSYVPLASELAAEQARLVAITEDERLRQDLARHVAERRRQEIDGFLDDLAADLRTTVYETVTAALRGLQNGGYPAPRTVAALHRLTERVRLLNVYGDQDIETQIRRLEGALVLPKRRTAVAAEQLRTALIDLRETTRSAVEQAFTIDPLITRFTLLDLSDDDTDRTAVAPLPALPALPA
jgi:hypothetical protein